MITEFKRAESVEEAVALAKEGFVFLAGGTQVNNTPFKKWGRPPERVVSLDALELGGIERDGDELVIGAGTTLQEIADSELVPQALRTAAGFIPTRSVRNIATIGGNVGANRPDSYMIPAMIAVGAVARTANAGEVKVETYVAEERDDLILEFLIPPLEGFAQAVKESRSQLALPVVSAAVQLIADAGEIAAAVVVAGCVAKHAVRLTSVEQAIVDGSDNLEAAIAKAIDPKANTLGSAEYKRYINSVVIADCIRRCRKEVLA